MPPRSAFPAVLSTRSFHLRSRFHTSAILPAEAREDTHYETFNLPPHSTRAEIKRRYFELSKVHHPDHNRNDPQASKRFVKISTAYGILGHERNREKYDRDLARRHGSKAQHTGPVGGRPASGLSRRRGQFYGPPPSFFRSGRWSTFKGKPTHTGQGRPSHSGIEGGGIGVGGSASGWADDVPHFNYGQKCRQHQERQDRWAHRARQRKLEPDTGIVVPLIGVATILVSVISVAAYTSW